MQTDQEGKLHVTLRRDAHCSSPQLLSTGMPFPQGALTSISQLRLTSDNGDIDCHCRTLARWPDQSIKWLEISAVDSNGLPESCRLSVTPYPVKTLPQESAQGLSVEESIDNFLITGGGHHLTLNKSKLSVPLSDECRADSFVELCDAHNNVWFAYAEEHRVEHACSPITGDTLSLLVTMSGRFRNEQAQSHIAFTAHYRIYAGLPAKSLELVIHNPAAAVHENGLWDLGDPNAFYFNSLAVCQTLSPDDEILYRLAPGEDFQPLPGQSLSISQVASGGENWQSPVHVNRHNKLPFDRNGFVVESDGHELLAGNRCQPQLKNSTSHYVITIADFWQNFPSALTCTSAQIRMELFPVVQNEPHELQGGEKKSHTVWFAENDLSLDSCLEDAQWHFDPAWTQQCNVLAHFSATRPTDELHAIIQQGLDGESSFFAKREQLDEYGWRNFGDLYADHEAAYQDGSEIFVSHYNNQYDPLYGMLRQYLLTGDNRWFELANDLAAHVVDIDIYHTEFDKPEYNGGLFWHTDHYLQAYTSSHRSYSKHHEQGAYMDHAGGGGPGGQHCYTSGLMLHYFLTGDERSKQAVLTLTKWITRVYEGSGTCLELALSLRNRHVRGLKNPFKEQYPLDRGTANYIQALLDSFELTQNKAYLAHAEHVILHTFHPNDDVEERDLKNIEHCWFYTVFLQAVTRYLFVKSHQDECDEYFYQARDALVLYAQWMAENEQPYLHTPEILEYPNDTWTAQDLRKVNVLLLANYYSNNQYAAMEQKANQLLSYITQRLAHSEEQHYCRILALLMQNTGVSEFYKSAPAPTDYAPVRNNWPPATYQKNLALNASSAIVRRAATLSLTNEKAWLAPRLGTSAPSVAEVTRSTQPPLLFVLSIDTEEEWDWEQGFPESDFALDNIKQLPGLQALFAELGVRPTYFVDYAVADDSQAVHTLRPYVEEKLCEIGAHLHPWANPPFYGATGERESHVVNLPSSQVEAKLKALIDKLREQFGTTPRSFRTGRWGINGEVLQLLTQCGIDVDSSVYPFYRTDYFDCSDAPLLPYWPDSQNPNVAGAQRAIYEIPVTVGFNRADFSKSNAIYKQLSHPAAKLLRPVGVAWHTRLLRQLYLCPELTTSDDMIALCQRALENDYPVLHMFMHSSSLVDNGNSLVAQKNAFETITTAIRRVVDFVSERRAVRFCTISEAGHLLKQRR